VKFPQGLLACEDEVAPDSQFTARNNDLHPAKGDRPAKMGVISKPIKALDHALKFDRIEEIRTVLTDFLSEFLRHFLLGRV
jgi:hypothetical protein